MSVQNCVCIWLGCMHALNAYDTLMLQLKNFNLIVRVIGIHKGVQ